MIIGFTGPAGAGKSTAAGILRESGWAVLSFADPLRALARQIHPDWDDWYFGAGKELTTDPNLYSPRQLMRLLGDHINSLCPGAFVHHLARRLETWAGMGGVPGLVIDDVRYPAEAAMLRERGATIVHVTRPDIDYRRDHSTEQPLPLGDGDQRLHNRGDLAALTSELSAICRLLATARGCEA